ncbi:MAG: putative Ig domain-containing protein [Pannonibacter phragmitetus]
MSPAAGSLTAGQVSTAYTQSVTASGGTGPYTYAVTSGALPAGLTLNTGTGEISGTPTTAGTANFTITATDANSATGSAAYSLLINAAPASNVATLGNLVLSQGTLTPGFASGTTSYTASVGDAVTSLSVTPAATDANATITVNGMPVTSGNASGAINLVTGNNAITVVVTAQDGVTTQTYTITVNRAAPPASIALSPAAGGLTAGQAGTAYSQTFTASGGTGPYTYAITSGSLPAGLTLAGTGELTGTPTSAGTANFTVTATDANNNTGSAAYSLQVTAPPASISFSPAGGALPEAMAGEDYTAAITVSGGTGPYLFSVSAGALPPGMVLNVSTGALNGPLNADAEGSYSFTIQVSDASNAVASAAYTLEVKKRAVTVTDKVVTVPAGSTPGNVNLAAGATGGPFIDANLLSVEPANAGTARIVNSQFAQAGGGGSAGFYLKFTPNPSYSGQVIIRFSLTSDLGVSNTGSVIYNLGYNPEKVATEIDSIVRGFVRTRQGLIANAVKVPGLRDRRRMQTANEIVSMRFTPSERGMSLGFATSLEQMNAASNALTPDLKAEAMAFNVWIQGSATAHTRKQNDGRWGSFAMLSTGADYLLADWALLGVSFHYDRMSDPTPNGARLSGNGWLAGPYASIEVYRNVFWDTRLFIGGSSNDIDTEFWDGNFDTTRWMADTALSGEWNLDAATTLSPTLRAVYLSEKVKDYGVRNSAGDQILMDGFIEEQFRVSGALELARLFILDNGMLLTPAVELTGGYAGLGGRGAFGAAEGSLTLTDGSRWRLNAGVKVNVEGDGSTSLTAKAGAGIRF